MRGVTGTGMRRRVPPAPLVQLVGTGQSLSVGAHGGNFSTTQPFQNLKIFDSSGSYTNPSAGTVSTVALVSPQRPGGGGADYPGNIDSEDFTVPWSNATTALGQNRGWGGQFGGFRTCATSVGRDGVTFPALQPSTASFNGALFECGAYHRYFPGHKVGAVGLVHGESDAISFTTQASYLSFLTGLQSSYQTQLQAITSQTDTIRLIGSQHNTCPNVGLGLDSSDAALWQAAQASSLIVLACPKYQYPHFSDNLHLTDYRPLGEKYAQVYMLLLDGVAWLPTSPIAAGITRNANVVTIPFHVPFGALVLDTTKAAPHQSGTFAAYWANGMGFEAYDNLLQISSVTGAGTNPIVVGFTTPHNLTTGATLAVEYIAASGVSGTTYPNAYGIFTITVVDSTHVSLNGTTGQGTYIQGGQAFVPIVISSVAVVGRSVIITMARSPTTNLRIGYADHSSAAYNTQPGAGVSGQPLFGNGRCGLLRDSDPFTGPTCAPYVPTGFANFNWAISFVQAVT